jgi:hypothetical protein
VRSDVRNLGDGIVEGGLISGRRHRGAADLPDVLKGSGINLAVGGWRLEVVQDADVSAHGY